MADNVIERVLNLPPELQRHIWRSIIPSIEKEETWGLGHLVEYHRDPIRPQKFYPSHPIAQSPIGHAYMQELIRVNPVVITANLNGMMRRTYPYATTQLQEWDRERSDLCKQLESWANFADKFESFQAMCPMTVVFKFPHWVGGAIATSRNYLPVVRSSLRNLISLALRLPPGKLQVKMVFPVWGVPLFETPLKDRELTLTLSDPQQYKQRYTEVLQDLHKEFMGRLRPNGYTVADIGTWPAWLQELEWFIELVCDYACQRHQKENWRLYYREIVMQELSDQVRQPVILVT